MANSPRYDLNAIAKGVAANRSQVSAATELFESGLTIPFVARYRHHHTGGLTESQLRDIRQRLDAQLRLADRRQTLLRTLADQTPDREALESAIAAARSQEDLDDLLPACRRPRQDPALEALVDAILDPSVDDADVAARVQQLATGDPTTADASSTQNPFTSVDDVHTASDDLLRDRYACHPKLRALTRTRLRTDGTLRTKTSSPAKPAEGQASASTSPLPTDLDVRVNKLSPHQLLAIHRAQSEQSESQPTLEVRIDVDHAPLVEAIASTLIPADHPRHAHLRAALSAALTSDVVAVVARDLIRYETDKARRHALAVFQRSLRELLLQKPIGQQSVLAIHPDHRTGTQVVALSATGEVLDQAVIRLATSQVGRAKSRATLAELLAKHDVKHVAIGSDPGCRRAEELVASILAGPEPTPSAAPAADTAQPVEPSDVQQSPDATTPTPGETTSSENTSDESKNTETATTESETTESETTAPPAESTPPDQPADTASTDTASTDTASTDTASADRIPTNTIPAVAQPATASTAPPADTPSESPAPPPLPQLDSDITYAVVSTAGASAYASNACGREDHPDATAAQRVAIAIGRRLQNPLAEFAKVAPHEIGVGPYRHDVVDDEFHPELDDTVSSCVAAVGVDVNSAHAALLRHVPGLNQLTARRLVERRSADGPFTSREQIRAVPGLSEQAFLQAAPFLRVVPDATAGAPTPPEPLDATPLHPDQYALARRLTAHLDPSAANDLTAAKLAELAARAQSEDHAALAATLETTPECLAELLALFPPTTADESPRRGPIFRRALVSLDDLAVGMRLEGTVVNVVDFGAFVDVGLDDSGLVHISQLSDGFVSNPDDIVHVAQIVTAWVMSIDNDRRRLALTMIDPTRRREQHERRRRKKGKKPQSAKPPAAKSAGKNGNATEGSSRRKRSRSNHRKDAAARPPAKRRPARPTPPPPPLTEEKKTGKQPLQTFGELKQFLDKKDDSAT